MAILSDNATEHTLTAEPSARLETAARIFAEWLLTLDLPDFAAPEVTMDNDKCLSSL